jgi:hypothetical protein
MARGSWGWVASPNTCVGVIGIIHDKLVLARFQSGQSVYPLWMYTGVGIMLVMLPIGTSITKLGKMPKIKLKTRRSTRGGFEPTHLRSFSVQDTALPLLCVTFCAAVFAQRLRTTLQGAPFHRHSPRQTRTWVHSPTGP